MYNVQVCADATLIVVSAPKGKTGKTPSSGGRAGQEVYGSEKHIQSLNMVKRPGNMMPPA